MNIEYCTWDSGFFNKKIGKIEYDNSQESDFTQLLHTAKEDGYQLLYVFGNADMYVQDAVLEQFKGKLVDRKCLYSKTINADDSCESNAIEYELTELTHDLESLALLSGTHSRFRLDKGFDKADFQRLYSIWITRSLKKEIADKIFVVAESDKVMGMITLKFYENAGHIGLFAVSESAQSKGYGSSLINACVNEVIAKQLQRLEVPTQMGSVGACHFYEKSGFSIKSITNTYHFWL
jgi:dTDP-4-amino-4,6-dideoxy-D-galactose acyltransferase